MTTKYKYKTMYKQLNIPYIMRICCDIAQICSL
nr:MAG TPA: Sorbin homologous domain [Caudoviricetes sp.]